MVRKKQINRRDIVDQLKVMVFKVLRAAQNEQANGKFHSATFVPITFRDRESWLVGLEHLQGYGFYAVQVDAVVRSLKWVIRKIDDIDLPLTPDGLDTLILACEDLLGAIRAAPVRRSLKVAIPTNEAAILRSLANGGLIQKEIMEITGIKSRTTIHKILDALIGKRWVRRFPGRSRPDNKGRTHAVEGRSGYAITALGLKMIPD